MFGILFIAGGIWLLIATNSRHKKYLCYVGQIVDISPLSRSHTKYFTKCPIIVRVIIDNQPIVTSTWSTINCFWGSKNILEAKKKEHIGKTVHVYFNHQTPSRSIIKEYQKENIAAGIILIVVGIMLMFAELMIILAFLYGYI